MAYLVRAVPREGHDGRNRGGRRFLVAHPTRLEEHELTDEIRNDPLLIVMPEEAPTEGEGLTDNLRETREALERSESTCGELAEVNEALRARVDELAQEIGETQQERSEALAAAAGLTEQLETAKRTVDELLQRVANLEAELRDLNAARTQPVPDLDPAMTIKRGEPVEVDAGGRAKSAKAKD